MDKDSKLNILTEVGVFGELNIKDPTAKEVKSEMDEEEINKMIETAVMENKTISVE